MADLPQQTIDRIERNPLLKALHKIADLGSCGGHGGFQSAIDIAIAAICENDRQPRAIADVAAERQRQISGEGWTPEHDDEHDTGELARAAAAYAVAFRHSAGRLWPWSSEWWKPTDHRANLVKAGALIIAEIERVDRASARRSESVAA